MGVKVKKQRFSDSCKQFSEVKKNLHFTGLNQENKKGVTSLQRPEMTSMGSEKCKKMPYFTALVFSRGFICGFTQIF